MVDKRHNKREIAVDRTTFQRFLRFSADFRTSLRVSSVLTLLKRVYRLCESGDLCFATMEKQHHSESEMKALRSGPALGYMNRNGTLERLPCIYLAQERKIFVKSATELTK